MNDVVMQEVSEMALRGGFAPAAIAEQLELPVSSVYAILRKAGIPYSRRGIGNRQTGLTEDQREMFANKYAAGEASLLELCGEYDVSRTAAMNILRDFDVVYRGGTARSGELLARDEMAVQMYRDGATVADICVETGIAAPRLYVLLRRAGVTMRRQWHGVS